MVTKTAWHFTYKLIEPWSRRQRNKAKQVQPFLTKTPKTHFWMTTSLSYGAEKSKHPQVEEWNSHPVQKSTQNGPMIFNVRPGIWNN
jgi:hypothetical protein